MAPTDIRIVQLEQPLDYEGDTKWLQDGTHAVYTAYYQGVYGNTDPVRDAIDDVITFNDQNDNIRRWWCAVSGPDGDPASVVAVIKCDLNMQDQKLVDISLVVHPEWRRRGIGTMLLHFAEEHPDLVGRDVLINWEGAFNAAIDAGEQIQAPTGQGSAPANTPGLQFALANGYTFEQVERMSLCSLPVAPDTLERFIAGSQPQTLGYRTMVWDDCVPAEYLDGYAVLMTKIYTDAPKGDLRFEEEVWDADRVRRDQEAAKAKGWRRLIAVAQHEATGELAAMTLLAWKPDKPTFGHQEETVVLAAHRGHRLGMLIKALNLQALAEANPRCERLYTWNAEENDFMLSINVALGYRPYGGNCVVQKLR
ncbi:MAG: GNAT family N-acetyltransferase [Propionibacteriaceae bacterium]|jgi:GNAT superfamily N-acetyltransferase|nr:GNAT family N-acetyltransferase [Propionibacteriaceae bacterium]